MNHKLLFHNNKNEWINIVVDNKSELQKNYDEYDIDEEIVAYSLDKNERAHLEYDMTTDTFVLIYNVPKKEKIDNHYETIPMTFIIKEHRFITVTNHKNQYIVEDMIKYINRNNDVSLFKFLFSCLYMISDIYFPLVEEMDEERRLISDKLKEKTTKQNLLSLSDLEIGIVYFVSASKQNVVLLEQVKTNVIYRSINDTEKEQFEDALIEAKQLVEMTQLSSQILQQLSSTYNNILNNNLNDTMKVLTVLSILLTIPAIVTGFFGMNMPLPLEDNVFGWLIVIAGSAILWFVLSGILKKLMR